MNKEFLTLDDIKVGDRVKTNQLDNIYGVYILISNLVKLDNGRSEGIIEYIGKEKNKVMKDVYEECRKRDGRKPMIYINTYLEDGVYSV